MTAYAVKLVAPVPPDATTSVPDPGTVILTNVFASSFCIAVPAPPAAKLFSAVRSEASADVDSPGLTLQCDMVLYDYFLSW